MLECKAGRREGLSSEGCKQLQGAPTCSLSSLLWTVHMARIIHTVCKRPTAHKGDTRPSWLGFQGGGNLACEWEWGVPLRRTLSAMRLSIRSTRFVS